MPDLGLDDIELSSGGCQCAVTPHDAAEHRRIGLVLLLGLALALLRRET